MLSFEVLDSEWVADGERFSANDNPHEVSKPTKRLANLVAAAESAGALKVIEGLESNDFVQSQGDGEKALEEAMGEFVPPQPREDGTIEPGYWTGPWGEANRAQAAQEAAGSAFATTSIEVDGSEE